MGSHAENHATATRVTSTIDLVDPSWHDIVQYRDDGQALCTGTAALQTQLVALSVAMDAAVARFPLAISAYSANVRPLVGLLLAAIASTGVGGSTTKVVTSWIAIFPRTPERWSGTRAISS